MGWRRCASQVFSSTSCKLVALALARSRHGATAGKTISFRCRARNWLEYVRARESRAHLGRSVRTEGLQFLLGELLIRPVRGEGNFQSDRAELHLLYRST